MIFLVGYLRNEAKKGAGCIKILVKMLKIAPSKYIRKNTFTNKHYAYNEDVLFNPKNPVNPDSEPSVKGKVQL